MSIIPTHTPRVGLFVTCLVDLFRPTVGFAAIKLLGQTGCQVDVPIMQTCCGQPAYNNGDIADTRDVAKQVINAFAEFDYIVVPSGSCGGMLKQHYVELFKDDPDWHVKAEAFANRCYELISFLTDIRGMKQVDVRFDQVVTYHDSCCNLREMKVKQQPRQLLATVHGLKLVEMQETETCCGFGGTFCVKYPTISTRMVSDKVANIEATQAQVLLAGDMGCLLNIAGRLQRLQSNIKVYHLAEVLAGMTEDAGIGNQVL